MTTGYGTGLQGMTDRLDAIGGTLEIRSAAGEGTTVTGTVPMHERPPEEPIAWVDGWAARRAQSAATVPIAGWSASRAPTAAAPPGAPSPVTSGPKNSRSIAA